MGLNQTGDPLCLLNEEGVGALGLWGFEALKGQEKVVLSPLP